jgi:hypothetical protein
VSFRAAFSFYGGKSKILAFYPGAGRSVWINDADPGVFGMWLFIRDNYQQWRHAIADRVDVGARVSDLLPADAPAGLVSILQAEANQGTQGARGVHDQVTSMGAKCWPRIKAKLDWAHQQTQGWIITNLPYSEVKPDPATATWFIDPPYDNEAGRRYRQQVVDYGALRDWCLSRSGQVVVCENVGATWLPFEPVVERRGIRSRYQKSNAKEAIWTCER